MWEGGEAHSNHKIKTNGNFECTFWHFGEQKSDVRHLLHLRRPLVAPQLLHSGGPIVSSAACMSPVDCAGGPLREPGSFELLTLCLSTCTAQGLMGPERGLKALN